MVRDKNCKNGRDPITFNRLLKKEGTVLMNEEIGPEQKELENCDKSIRLISKERRFHTLDINMKNI